MQTSYDYTMTIGFPGQLADVSDNDIIHALQAEASAEIPFGVMCMKGTNDNDAKLPNSSSAKLIGVLVHTHAYEPRTDLGTVGVKPGAMLNIANKAKLYVTVEESVTKFDRAHVRYASGAGGTQLGAFRKSAVSGETIDVTKNCRFLSSASAGGVAVLEVDMQNA